MIEGGELCPARPEERISFWDTHVHCYPPEVIADPVAWARAHGEPHWERLVTDGPQGWADPEGLLRAMDAASVEKVLLQAWYWENPSTAELQNSWHAEWMQRYPDRFAACAALHPGLHDLEGALQSAKEWGACAVGECLPQVQSPDGWKHPGWETILEWTTAQGWPFCLHLTEPAGHDYPGRVETPLMEAVALFEKHPAQKWLCAHWGGGLPFHSLNRRVKKALKNVWFDTAASPLLYDSRIWRLVCDLIGPERILFGSDFPLRVYPRKQTLPSWDLLLEEFSQSGLSVDEQRLISRDNMARLFKLG
ncbi:amidohydrolase family protein [Puniceicoccales bacterium CK1056]|uniref:Amidohydrolase family protein n=1 Tax=Oceanipulchritudo coccoides TaxID=2706888 RepID=A0A6B2M1G4_9BACT|nr:amidohydrolase family protein [Oceanipulchritudo coccoides]NDV62768.1 amidohydrolase family protein [Oceanipulchritudo coccoides]